MSSDTYRTHLLERQKYDQSRGGELNQTESGQKRANDTKPLDYSFTRRKPTTLIVWMKPSN
jgi:hypothetical protein